LFSIGAAIKEHEVTLFDLRHSKPKKISTPEDLQDVIHFYRKDDAPLFHFTNRFTDLDHPMKKLSNLFQKNLIYFVFHRFLLFTQIMYKELLMSPLK